MLVNYNYLYNNKINFSLINSIPIKINITDTNIDSINKFFLHLEYPKRDIIISYLDEEKHINICNINSNNKLIPVIQQILSNDIYQYICCYNITKKKYDNINSTLALILNIYINKNYLTRIFNENKIPKFIDILFNYNKFQYISINKVKNLPQQLNQFEKEKFVFTLPTLIKTDRLINYINKLYIYHNNYQKKKVDYLTYNINGLVLININHKYLQFSNFLIKCTRQSDKTIIFAYKLDIYQWYYQIIKKNLKVCYIQTFRDYKKYYNTSNLNNYNIIIIAYEVLLNQNYRKLDIKLHNQYFTRIIYDNITDYLTDNPNKQILFQLQYFRSGFKYLLTNKLEYSNSEFSIVLNFISNYQKTISLRQLSYFRQQISNSCFYQGSYNIIKNITYQIINLPYSNLDKLIYLYHKRNIYNKPSYLYSPFISFYNYINKFYQKKNISCPICYENLENCPIIKTKCKHFFCLNCFFTIINTPQNNCPLCRGVINQNFSLTGKKLTNNDIISQDLKIIKLIDVISNQTDNKQKIIIYCRYQNIIKFLYDYFNHQGIKCFLNIMKWNKYHIYPSLLIINNLTKLNKIKTIQNIFILEKQNPYLNNRISQLKHFTNQINVIHLDNMN